MGTWGGENTSISPASSPVGGQASPAGASSGRADQQVSRDDAAGTGPAADDAVDEKKKQPVKLACNECRQQKVS